MGLVAVNHGDADVCLNFPTEPPVASFDSRIIYSPPVDLIMDNFQQHKEEDERWTSPPFTTHPNGYQMCLQVSPNGFEDGKDTHLCVAARLMKGADDDHLPWPFRGSLTVQLIDQKLKGKPVEHRISFTNLDDESTSGRVINGKVLDIGMIANVGRSIPKFIELAELLNPTDETSYLHQDKLKLRVKEAVSYTSRVSSRVPQWAMSSRMSIAELTMTNFQKHREAGDEWVSPPFFTHDGGYQLCLSVYANGLLSGTGSHVSVYAQMMAGPNDDHLKWPFEARITVQMINWKHDGNHVQNTMDIDGDDNASQRVTDSEVVSGKTGWTHFISHKELLDPTSEDTLYVEDDTIRFRIPDIHLRTIV